MDACNAYTFYDKIEREIFPYDFQVAGCNDFIAKSGRIPSISANYWATCIMAKLRVWQLPAQRKWVFLSDDRAARQAAAKLDVPVSGTLGYWFRW